MIFCPLASGSSGNAVYIEYQSTGIIVDCGVSGKLINEGLAKVGADISKLSGICVTHEHTDHIKSVGVVSRKFNIPVYANRGTWQNMASTLGEISEENIKVFKNDAPFRIGDIIVKPYSTYHDSVSPVAYTFFCGEEKLCCLTDIGHIDDKILKELAGCSVIYLEANHDICMLKNGPYPYSLKYRIAGENGHLSNDTCARLALFLAKRGTKSFCLGHLSNENNTEELAFKTVSEFLKEGLGNDYNSINLCVAKRNEATLFVK